MICVCFFGLYGSVAFYKWEANAVKFRCEFESKLSKNTEVFGPHQKVQTLSQMVKVQYGEILVMQKHRLD